MLIRCLWLLVVAVCACGASSASDVPNSCVDCHSALDAPLKVTPEQFAQDIHSQKGLTCASCHGGDPNLMDDAAMSPKAGFRKIKRADIPALCGRCHSDGAYMRQYNPKLRTDQLSQYQTSVHGKLLAKGDTKVAVCIDCHSVHDLRPASDTRSTVHPLNIPQTCGHCHADAAYMKDHKIPTDQLGNYKQSVHYEALTVRGDLSAPNCTTCHGNHGAAPPGVETVQNVCATCHVFQSQLFDASPHKEAFKKAGLPGCIQCHSNHKIVHTSDEMIGTGKQAFCTDCHMEGEPAYKAAGAIHDQLARLDATLKNAGTLIATAESSGMEVSEARSDQEQARDALTKARVTVHSLSVAHVNQDVDAGLKIADKVQKAGESALVERDYRRKGLGLSLIAILIMMIGLAMYIRQIERKA